MYLEKKARARASSLDREVEEEEHLEGECATSPSALSTALGPTLRLEAAVLAASGETRGSRLYTERQSSPVRSRRTLSERGGAFRCAVQSAHVAVIRTVCIMF